jgi:hypothetical protein
MQVFFDHKGSKDGQRQDPRDHRGRSLSVYEDFVDIHLGADEDEHQREPDLEISEKIQDAGEQEVERSQTQHCKDVAA